MPTLELLNREVIPGEIASLIDDAPLPSIGESGANLPCESVELALKSANLQGTLAEAGLWLLAGELDRSHGISQDNDSSLGSYWHGIMHRREGDFGNAKYWFRRVGKCHLFDDLAEHVTNHQDQLLSGLPLSDLNSGSRIAEALVDCSQAALTNQSDWIDDIATICWWEWQLLFSASL